MEQHDEAHIDHLTGRKLPIIIDGPGTYILRNGGEAVIHAVQGPGSCSCKGHRIRPDSLGRRYKHYDIWQPNGRIRFLGEHQWDIVAKRS